VADQEIALRALAEVGVARTAAVGLAHAIEVGEEFFHVISASQFYGRQ
jgi:hypothetical protein